MYFRTKVDIKSVIRDYLLRNYVVNVQSFKTCKLSINAVCSWAKNCRRLMHAMYTAKLTNLCLTLSFILVVVSTGQKSSELLFTLTLGSYYRRTKTLFHKRNTQH